MPELPDVELYVEALRRRVVGEPLRRVRVANPFLVRSFEPPLAAAADLRVEHVRRIGKRIVFDLETDLHVVLHLMIAGRLRWRTPDAKIPRKIGLAAFDFSRGTLLLTEASTKRRASLHVVRGDEAVRALDPGGLEPLSADRDAFEAALRRESHTFKRALTDPHIFSGIGNAYSDEILWHARVSPLRMTRAATSEEVGRLYDSTKSTLRDWVERLRRETGEAFPEEVTAFREGMAVHGRYGKPCPACGAPVQRIVYAQIEANYCAECQTGGKLLADRALSRLMRGDWPKTLEELEQQKAERRQARDAPPGRRGSRPLT
ncbi:MAG TPA: DNA-formamidopyrimidine glycosylase family protein [Polyangiaceae bacterium]|nr:DNA-formamidopyrimidine glycosylase family protein [Polyangiaceae bacterium]